ncbi:MAG: TIR domain-containing protein [Bacilli bacterium]|nr:TIR domain-containing protein [Bacilli bacterium]
MIELKYKTRDHTSPKGKPRVYFSAHPSDYKYFDEITDEILDKENCVIYYFDDFSENIDYEDFMLQLNQMQMFVIPITNKFLNTKNRALEIEFKYAMEKHIPILPLMYGEKLEKDFNEKCGDLQFLDKFKVDDTAISYEKKLNDFLSAILINDELANEIREAFDAYIFLSYRKKDRKYAQELMKLIHKNDNFRDIAIWYDEFLTPGENFNEEIDEALNKSKFFALVVTPNIIEKDNYVMRIEYPRAKEVNKPIMALESVKTDQNDLKEKYLDIPECIDAYDEVKISEAMLDFLQGVATTSNDTPRHNYLIGLAYLKGIDVEVDKKKALFLIEDSASKGNIDSIKKLIDMYSVGDSVKVDDLKKLYWEEKLVEEYKKQEKDIRLRYDDYSDEYIEFYDNYLSALTSFAMTTIFCFDIEKGELILNNSLSIVENLKKDEIKYYDKLSNIYFVLAGSYEHDEKYTKALEYYYKRLECNQKLVKLNRSEYLKELADSYYRVAKLQRYHKLFDDAKKSFKIALILYEEILNAEENDKNEVRISLAECYYEVGVVEILLDKIELTRDKVEPLFKKALELSREYINGKVRRYNIMMFKSIFVDIANFAVITGNYEIANKLYKEVIDVLENQKKEELKEYCLEQTIDVNLVLASMYDRSGDLINSEYYYNKAIKIYNDLIVYDDSYISNLANVYRNFSNLYIKNKNYARAKELIDMAYELVKDTQNHYSLALTFAKYFDLYNELNYSNKAEEYILKAIECAKKLEDINPNDYFELMFFCYIEKYSNSCSITWENLYDSCYKPMTDIYLKLPSSSPYASSYKVANALYFAGATLRCKSNDYDKVEKLLLLSLECFKKATKESPVDYKGAICGVYNELAQMYMDKGDLLKAKEYLDNALNDTKDENKVCLERIDTLKLISKINNEDIKEYYNSSIALLYKYKDSNDDDKDSKKIAITLAKILCEYANELTKFNDLNKANELYKQALNEVKGFYDYLKENYSTNKLIADCYFNVGFNSDNYKEGEKNLTSALEIYKYLEKESDNDDELVYKIVKTFNAIGYMNVKLKNYDKAIEFINKAIDRCLSLTQTDSIYYWELTKYMANLGYIYIDLKQYETAIKYFKLALNNLEILKENKVPYLWRASYYNKDIFDCELKLNHYDEARKSIYDVLEAYYMLYELNEDIKIETVIEIFDVVLNDERLLDSDVLNIIEKLSQYIK